MCLEVVVIMLWQAQLICVRLRLFEWYKAKAETSVAHVLLQKFVWHQQFVTELHMTSAPLYLTSFPWFCSFPFHVVTTWSNNICIHISFSKGWCSWPFGFSNSVARVLLLLYSHCMSNPFVCHFFSFLFFANSFLKYFRYNYSLEVLFT